MVMLSKVKFILFFSLLVMVNPVFAQDLVEPYETEQEDIDDLLTLNLHQSDASRFSYNPYTEVPSGGNGSTESQPYVTYLAYQNAANTSIYQYFVKGKGSVAARGPVFLDETGGTTQSINIPLKIDTNGERSLYVAINVSNTSFSSLYEKDNDYEFNNFENQADDHSLMADSWYVIYKTTTTITSTSTSDLRYDLSFDPRIFCKTSGVTVAACSLLTAGATNRLRLYVFTADTSTTSISVGGSVTPSSFSGGLYWDFKVSAAIPTLNSAITVDSTLTPGESRLTFDYTISNSIADFKEKAILYSTSSSSPGSLDFSTIYNSMTNPVLSLDNYGTSLSGELTFKGLTNGTTYYAYLGAVNKYYLAPNFSSQTSGTPAKISELLEKNACFFLTAGFREDNKIIRSFRLFRDHVLLKFPSGKAFVKVYYYVGPRLAPYILKSEAISLVIRGWATALYSLVMNSIELICAGIVFIFMVLLRNFVLPFFKESVKMSKRGQEVN